MSVQSPRAAVIRVVLADDQDLVRSGFAMILNAQPDIEVVAEAGDGAAALEAVYQHIPDVVLLDIRMPGMDGIEAAKVVCAQTRCRVLMLTTFDQDDYVYDALYAGASGFLLKNVRRDDLVHAVVVGQRAALARLSTDVPVSIPWILLGEVTAACAALAIIASTLPVWGMLRSGLAELAGPQQ